MPDLHKSVRQDMLDKPAGKLGGVQRHHLGFAFIFVVFPGKTDRPDFPLKAVILELLMATRCV